MFKLSTIALSALSLALLSACHAFASAEPDPDNPPPAVGQSAPDLELESLRGGNVKLSELTNDGPVVLLVLRGYPTYQCPICNRQMGDFISKHEQFAQLGARVVLVYPGPSDELKKKAEEFVGDGVLPENFDVLLDPDYTFTNAYNLRWDAPRETAYPSTFVIVQGEQRTIGYAHISHTHGNRTKADDVIKEVGKVVE